MKVLKRVIASVLAALIAFLAVYFNIFGVVDKSAEEYCDIACECQVADIKARAEEFRKNL